jgi:hypothetical protein
LGEVGGSQKDSTFAAAKGIHQKVVAGACQLNPFPPSLPTHAGARATLRGKRSPSIHLGHLRPPWPEAQSPLAFIVWRTLFGWHLLWSVVQSDVIPSFSCSLAYFPLLLVIIMWRILQAFRLRSSVDVSVDVAVEVISLTLL